MAYEARDKLRAGLDPRQPIYRDRFNEYFTFILSAVGAGVVVPVILLIVAVIVDQFSIAIFLPAAVVLELALIFALARPQMQPTERVGWALLWGTATAILAAAFYYLVLDNIL